MTDKVQKIREEVERLKSNLIHGACSSQVAMETSCKKEAYNEVLSILDSLQEEPVSDELEEAAIMHYKDVMEYEAKTGLKPAYMTSFKAGANWQKQQMMEDAMLCALGWYDGFVPEFTQEQLHNVIEKNGLDVGDKISVIILKQDD